MIPLWINGHAFLSLAPAFHDVRHVLSGEILRRTPLCAPAVATQAVAAARAALPAWSACAAEARAARLLALAAAVEEHAGHLARLLAEESAPAAAGDAAASEIAAVLALLSDETPGEWRPSEVVSLSGAVEQPLLSVLRTAVPALRDGCTLVVVTSPQAPSALVALAELATRCAIPDGVVNVVHGDAVLLAAVRQAHAADSPATSAGS